MLWLIAVLALTLVPYGLGIKALIDATDSRSAVRRLADEVRALERRLRLLEGRLPAGTGAATIETPAAAPSPDAPQPVPEPATAAETVPTPPPAAPVPAVAVRTRRLEQRLVEHWLVWLGGLTLALGGAFLVKFSIDQGWLTPIVRVCLGVLLGFTLSAAAEWVLRRESEGTAGSSYVPQALAAAGTTTIFASFFAAHQLYGLLPAALAFPLLALIAGATVTLSFRHGPFVAALGLCGAFAVPILVQSNEPHALPLFGYLTLVGAGSAFVLRQRDWSWLAGIWLGALAVWVLLWLVTASAPQAGVVGVFLLAQFGLLAALRQKLPWIGFLSAPRDVPALRIVARTGCWMIAALLLMLVHADGFGTASLIPALFFVGALLWFVFHDPALDDLLAAPAALVLALLATWNLPRPIRPTESVLPALPPDQVIRFAIVAVVTAVVFGGVFTLLPRVARPSRWAALSAAAPPLILAIAYAQLRSYGFDIAWTGVALALAVLELGAAAWAARHRSEEGFETALAAYAIGVLAATILSVTFALSNAWLTVALALHLPALGWVDGRVRVPVLRRLALGVAGLVLVRLALNPEVLRYSISEQPLFNWLLYGYGIPALAFIAATRQFGGRADDLLVQVLEGGSILFTMLLITLELRHFFYARIDAPLQSLAPDSVQTIVWLAGALLLLRLGGSRSRPVLTWGGIILFGGATLQAVIWQAGFANPLATGSSVGRWLVFDALTLAYGLPALLYGAIAQAERGSAALIWAARALAIIFGFLWLTLEIRHGFQGEILSVGSIGEIEWYAYSLGWLVVAALCLALSFVLQREWLRRVALLAIGVVVGKVFLSDMGELTGILRALSFLGLGAALVAISYAYRHLRPAQAE